MSFNTNKKTTFFTEQNQRAIYDVSRWHRCLYDGRVSEDGALGKAHNSVKDALINAYRNDANGEAGGVDDDLTWSDRLEDADVFGSEVFSRLYGNPSRLENNAAPPWMNWMQDVLSELPEWDNLRQQVSGDPDFSALAAAGVIERTAEQLEQFIEKSREEQKREEAGEDPSPEGLPSARDGMKAAMRAACEAAAEDVASGQEALAGLAPGTEHCPPQHEQHDPARMNLAERLMNDPRMQEAIRRAGRIQRIAGRSKPTVTQNKEEIVGVEFGDDVPRLLPSETMKLMDEDLEWLLLKDIAEGRALQYSMEGREPQGRGPMVFMVDESGSMHGDAHLWARAIALAGIGQAAQQNRAITIIGFDTGIRSVYRLTANGKAHRLSPRDPQEVWEDLGSIGHLALAVANQDVNGGTDFNVVFDYALKSGVREERADLVFVTDGGATASEDIIRDLNECKENGLRVYGLTVNGGSISPAVQALCDETEDLDQVKDPAQSFGRMTRGMHK